MSCQCCCGTRHGPSPRDASARQRGWARLTEPTTANRERLEAALKELLQGNSAKASLELYEGSLEETTVCLMNVPSEFVAPTWVRLLQMIRAAPLGMVLVVRSALSAGYVSARLRR